MKTKLRHEVASGRRGAYYPKRSELKKMEAEAKFGEIRKRDGNEAVDAAIAKRSLEEECCQGGGEEHAIAHHDFVMAENKYGNTWNGHCVFNIKIKTVYVYYYYYCYSFR